jgi:hypothetical protein
MESSVAPNQALEAPTIAAAFRITAAAHAGATALRTRDGSV